jgi:hypothetical protein
MSEHTITFEYAEKWLQKNDPWGTTRLYGIIGEGETAGQIIGIKTQFQLERFKYSRIYLIISDGKVPIKRR